jgi:hypothetical protein
MSTAVQVCSNALVELGGLPINSFDNLSDRALAAANLYPQIRDAVLRSHPWNCATKRVVLSPDSVAPAFGWDYAFTLPGNNLRVLSITPDREREPFALEDGKILCDTDTVYLRYIYRNDNPAKWDATLTRAMTLAMAAVLAIPVTEDKDKKVEKERELQALLRTARAVDGQEEPPDEIDDFPLLAARF